MDIIVTMLTGESCTVRVQPQDTVASLKCVIHQKLNVAPERQRLVFVNGQRTDLSDNSRQVSQYGLQSGCMVSLLVIEPVSIQVFLRNDKGQVNTYDITPEETVSDFKKRVQHREGVAENQQRLVFQGREMTAGKLSDYNVGPLCTIDLLLRLRGGRAVDTAWI